MLQLVQSNSMQVLLERLLEQLSVPSEQPLLTPQSILVQSPGMAQWLQIRIAEAFGIAANYDFPLPSSYIWRCYQRLIPDLPEQSAFNKGAISWKLMNLLPQFIASDDVDFQPLRDYLADDGADRLKRYQLCLKIADLYDQYLVYRPDWILAWEQGEDQLPDTDIRGQNWQPKLWRALVARSAACGESPYHRANLQQALLDLAQQPAIAGETIIVFGISALPRQQLEVMQALAQHNQVIIYWLNPSEHYWGDVVDNKTRSRALVEDSEQADYLDVGNPLLSAWGKMGRDFLDMLIDLQPQQLDDFYCPEPRSMLAHIQQEIMQLTHRGSMEPLSPNELLSNGQAYPKIALCNQDNSLRLMLCHSKVRELEVLHDQLLHRFKQDPSLEPSDVIVMVPNIADYAAVIDGVFGSVPGDLYIPYAISDQTTDQASILSHFCRLMGLHRSRLTLAEILDLLQAPAVLRKFELNEDEFNRIAHWLQDAGVRWGLSGADKQRWQVPQEGQNSLLFGLRRLLSGYAMAADGLWLAHSLDIAPYADIEGQNAEALGKFYLFVEQLQACVDFCQSLMSVELKIKQAEAWTQRFYQPDDQESSLLNILREKLVEIQQRAAGYTDDMSQAILLQEIQQALEEKGVGQGFLAGKVNFCTLMPMRSIPFKQVCVLGLNDGDYPRQSTSTGFDLIANGRSRKGDRSRRLDDRYLFLEAILSAREQLYLSYVARSQKDNSPKPPSILVQELLVYCQQVFCLQGQRGLQVEQSEHNVIQHLSCEQHLLPFDANYFNSQIPLELSFQGKWAQVLEARNQPWQAKPLATESVVNMGLAPLQIGLDDWLAFFINPAKAYFIRHWQLTLPRQQNDLLDDEPFALDALDNYQLNQRWLNRQFDANDHGDFARVLRAEGKLPYGLPGEQQWQQQEDKMQPLLAELSERLNKPQWRAEIDLALPELRVIGWQNKLYDKELVMWRPGDLSGKDRLHLWLPWLCLCASKQLSGKLERAVFVARDITLNLKLVPQNEAMEYLQQFALAWRQGQESALHFYPKTAWKWVTTDDFNKCMDEFNGIYKRIGEGAEPHIARLCPELAVHADTLCHWAEQLLTPIQEYSEECK